MKIYDKITQTYKELVLKPGGDTLPIGAIVEYGSETIPNNWLLCDGRAISRTTYSELFKVLGTTFGSGDGSTTFNLPNRKGTVGIGKDENDTDFNTLGKTGGGTAKDKIKVAGSYYGLVDTKIVTGTGYGGQGLVSVTKNTSESAQSLENNGIDLMPPYIVTNYIIKAKNTVVVKGEVIQETGTASETNVYSSVAVDNKIKTNIVTGQEVATNEYIDGKQVFVKRINLGSLPNANEKIVTTDLNVNNVNIIKIDGIAYGSATSISYILTLPDINPLDYSRATRLTMDTENNIWRVKIRAGVDRSNYTGYANVYYTKK